MRYINRIVWLMSGLLLSACSHFHSSSNETKFVKYSNSTPPLVMPAGIKNPTSISYYPVPPVVHYAPVGTKPPLAPPGSQLTVKKPVSKTVTSTLPPPAASVK